MGEGSLLFSGDPTVALCPAHWGTHSGDTKPVLEKGQLHLLSRIYFKMALEHKRGPASWGSDMLLLKMPLIYSGQK